MRRHFEKLSALWSHHIRHNQPLLESGWIEKDKISALQMGNNQFEMDGRLWSQQRQPFQR
jgi:hypothetical protein